MPPPPVKQASLVVVPVSGMSRLTAEGISVALSLGDDVIAVTVVYTDEADDPDDVPDVDFRAEWEAWRPEVPLLTLRSAHRSLAKPIVHYLRSVEAEDKYHRLVVLIPEVEPSKPWEWILHNQRGIILERAIRRGTSNVVLCRLRYRLATLTATPAGAVSAGGYTRGGCRGGTAEPYRGRPRARGRSAWHVRRWQDSRHGFPRGGRTVTMPARSQRAGRRGHRREPRHRP